MTEDFSKKQKELIEYEFKLYSKQEKEHEAKFQKMMENNTKNFLNGIQKLLDKKNKETTIEVGADLRQFFSSYDE